jgi:uroporphyrinogen III methyltransferase/synthase
LQALVGSPDGQQMIRVSGSGDDAERLGLQLARQAIAQGAGNILASLETTGSVQALAGKRIVVTRAQAQAAEFSRKLADLGAISVEIPMIRIAPMPDTAPLDDALQNLERYDWLILTSVNGVEIVWQRATEVLGHAPACSAIKVATVGPATARALIERGVQPAFTPDEFVGQAVAAGMGHLSGQRILLPRAEIASPLLPDMLRAQGAEVDAIAAYCTLPAEVHASARSHLDQGVDVLTFSSASAVRNWVASFGDNSRPRNCLIACIGPVTARAAQELDLAADIVPSEYTLDGMLQALIAHFR